MHELNEWFETMHGIRCLNIVQMAKEHSPLKQNIVYEPLVRELSLENPPIK